MGVEVFVFRREIGADQKARHSLNRQIKPSFLGILGQKPAVARMNPGHHGWLIVLQLGVVGKVLRVLPDYEREGARRQQPHKGGASEKEREESEDQAHRPEPSEVTLRQEPIFAASERSI